MSLLQTKRPKVKHPSESLSFGVNLTQWLLTGETVSSVTVNAENGLTVSSAAANVTTFEDDDEETCAIGQGVTFTCSGGAADRNYLVTLTVTLSSARVLCPVLLVQVRDR